MQTEIYTNYLQILNEELVVALGCTEPIAVAYAAAKARDILGCMPEKCIITCSGNIIKNVMGVTVPNSNGVKGIKAAAILGIIGGDASRKLAVLENITDTHRKLMKKLQETEFCTVEHIENVPNLYIRTELMSREHAVSVEIKDTHTHITRAVKDGVILYNEAIKESSAPEADRSLLAVDRILEFADAVDLDEIHPIISKQIEYNMALAEEGLNGSYGAEVGKTLYTPQSSVWIKACAYAAAGSDARMNGCALPAVINSGSGNQGITASIPVLIYARHYQIPDEKLFRALVVSNLVALHQKRFIGRLSAYCGAVSAACGAAAGIAYMLGYGYDTVSMVITNTIASIGGMICDGAKSSCAAKIANAVNAALLAFEMSKKGHAFAPGEGIVKENVEDTIKSAGRVARVGMYQTDIEIINVMLDKKDRPTCSKV